MLKFYDLSYQNKPSLACENLGNLTFKGKPLSLFKASLDIPKEGEVSAEQAIKAWEKMKDYRYSDSLSDVSFPSNKEIREENYNIFDRVTRAPEIKKFVKHFLSHPLIDNCILVSPEKIFKKAVYKASEKINKLYGTDACDIVDSGFHDSLDKKNGVVPFIGMRLNSPYIIIAGRDYASKPSYVSDRTMIKKFQIDFKKGLDHRFITTHKPHAMPQVMTLRDFKKSLKSLDNKTNRILEADDLSLENAPNVYRRIASFNERLAENLNKQERFKAKNFAFLIESIKANNKEENKDGGSKLKKEFNKICEQSSFLKMSNITKEFASYHNEAAKIKNYLSKIFSDGIDSWDVSEQYSLIKDLIKFPAGDQGQEFRMFTIGEERIQKNIFKYIKNVIEGKEQW